MNEKRGIYQGLSLPVSLISDIKKHIKKHRGYKGVTEFVRQAIREKLHSESSDSMGPRGVAFFDWLLRGKTIETKVTCIEEKMISLEEKFDILITELKKKSKE